MSTLREQYNKTIAPELQKSLDLKSKMAVPRISKVTVNVGAGRWLAGSKDTSELETNLATITGQKPVVTKAKKAISNFKTRAGMPIGVAVTLRGDRAYNFLDKFINVIAPRIRDFRGFPPKSFDGHGNYSIGLKDIQAFPEINPEKISKSTGLQITVCTTTESDDQARALLQAMNFPFRKKTNQHN